jgi:1-acyl-sn-glycerol-3-phosphate acyltransferase
MGQRSARFLINLFITLAARIEVHEAERVYQQKEGFVIASNHIGRLDAILIYNFIDRKDIIMLVAEKYREIPLARWFVKQLDAIWIERFNADFSALRQALNRLKKGGVLVLAPEGTRSPNAALQKAWPGVSYLAAKTGAPIIPVALVGCEDAKFFPNLKRLRRTQVTVYVGEPFTLPAVPMQNREVVLQQYTDEIMCRIAALLPPAYRGYYADFPRLKELLSGGKMD